MAENVNIPLIRKVVEWAEAEAAKPAIDCRWYQADWSINSWTQALRLVLANAGTPMLAADFALATRIEPYCGTCYCIAGYVTHLAGDMDDLIGVSDVIARNALGITDGQADILFNAFNTIGDVRRIAEDIAGERL